MRQTALVPETLANQSIDLPCGERNEVNMPIGSFSEGNILVIRPWRNLAASGPCNASNPREGLKLTHPVVGICGSSLPAFAGVEDEFHRREIYFSIWGNTVA